MFSALVPFLAAGALMAPPAGAGALGTPPDFIADTPLVRLTLAQVKARLAAGTEENPPDL